MLLNQSLRVGDSRRAEFLGTEGFPELGRFDAMFADGLVVERE